MGNPNHGTTYMDNGELRPWHFIYGQWGTPTMALLIWTMGNSDHGTTYMDNGQLRPWHYIHGRWGTLTMALHIRTQHRE
jgi:hypothetical protein